MSTIEQVKAFWNKRPCNIKHSSENVGSYEYFEDVRKKRYFVEPHIKEFADFSRWKGKKVLEIGCGIGTDTIEFALAGAQVTAVDLSCESLMIAKQRAKVYGVEDNITFYQGDAEELSEFVPLDLYDLVYSFGVIHHTPDPGNVLWNIDKYIDEISEVRIMLYHKRSWRVLEILWNTPIKYISKKNLNNIIALQSEAQTGCPITYTYTKKQAKELIEDNSLLIENIEIKHVFPYRVKDYKEQRYVKKWYFRFMPKLLFNYLSSKFGWHLCITARKGWLV